MSGGRAYRSDALHERYIRRWNLVGPPLRPSWEDLQPSCNAKLRAVGTPGRIGGTQR